MLENSQAVQPTICDQRHYPLKSLIMLTMILGPAPVDSQAMVLEE